MNKKINDDLLEFHKIKDSEYNLLKEFTYLAIFIPEGVEPLHFSVVNHPEIKMYYHDFGKSDDLGVVAEYDNKVVGIAWVRIIPGYGHVDNKTPELSISVIPEYRNKGIGKLLLNNLFNLLVEEGYSKTSLSVQKANSAYHLYKKVGYRIIEEKEEDYIMLKELVK